MRKNRGRTMAYFPEEMKAEIRAEAQRLHKPFSWVVQQCVRKVLPQIKAHPSPDEIALVPSDERDEGKKC